MTPERFWSKVDRRGPDECWPWLGTKTCAGYGVVSFTRFDERYQHNAQTTTGAHRVTYEELVGLIPEGLTLDHVVCANTSCVNPSHCEPVTRAENTRRQRAAQKAVA